MGWRKIQDLVNWIEGPMAAMSDGTYHVAYKGYESKTLGPIIHAIIFRADGQAIAGWDEIQRIKNEVFGDEANAYEVYPPSKHLVCSANARHLWIMKELPFGYRFRAVQPADVIAHRGTSVIHES